MDFLTTPEIRPQAQTVTRRPQDWSGIAKKAKAHRRRGGGKGRTFLYIICHNNGGELCGPVKIGISADPDDRVSSLQTANPHKLALFTTLEFETRMGATMIERHFHQVHSDFRLEGEWFHLAPEAALVYFEQFYAWGLENGLVHEVAP